MKFEQHNLRLGRINLCFSRNNGPNDTIKSFEYLYSYPSSISVNDDDSFNNYQFFYIKIDKNELEHIPTRKNISYTHIVQDIFMIFDLQD